MLKTQHEIDREKLCARCGHCCKERTCIVGILHGADPDNCHFLVGETPGFYECILVEENPRVIEPLAIGEGCCSSSNPDRIIALINQFFNKK